MILLNRCEKTLNLDNELIKKSLKKLGSEAFWVYFILRSYSVDKHECNFEPEWFPILLNSPLKACMDSLFVLEKFGLIENTSNGFILHDFDLVKKKIRVTKVSPTKSLLMFLYNLLNKPKWFPFGKEGMAAKTLLKNYTEEEIKFAFEYYKMHNKRQLRSFLGLIEYNYIVMEASKAFKKKEDAKKPLAKAVKPVIIDGKDLRVSKGGTSSKTLLQRLQEAEDE